MTYRDEYWDKDPIPPTKAQREWAEKKTMESFARRGVPPEVAYRLDEEKRKKYREYLAKRSKA